MRAQRAAPSDSAAWAAQRLLQRGPLDIHHVLYALADARLKDAGARAHRDRDPDLAGRCSAARRLECHAQADLIRCIFGDPFRPVPFHPSWLTPTAVAIAAGMYDARDFGAMPILADALQDAGCEDAEVLRHCREPGVHVKGCWVVDGVLGKG